MLMIGTWHRSWGARGGIVEGRNWSWFFKDEEHLRANWGQKREFQLKRTLSERPRDVGAHCFDSTSDVLTCLTSPLLKWPSSALTLFASMSFSNSQGCCSGSSLCPEHPVPDPSMSPSLVSFRSSLKYRSLKGLPNHKAKSWTKLNLTSGHWRLD